MGHMYDVYRTAYEFVFRVLVSPEVFFYFRSFGACRLTTACRFCDELM